MQTNPIAAKKQWLFIRNVIFFTFTSFGGAQAHLALLLKYFVQSTKFISEEELLELNALAQVLPGPASTQTLVGIAWKVGKLKLAIITFLIWILPTATIMTFAAISYALLDQKQKFNDILEYIQPIALGIVAYGAWKLGKKVLSSQVSIFLAIASVIATLVLRNAYVFPLSILIGGMISSAIETPKEEAELRVKLFSNINPKKLVYFLGALLLFALVGAIINRTSPFSLPIRLLENFYRNGILVFGGGQVLVPLMFTEFVEMKHYLPSSGFLSGFALQQALPGPTFSFTSYLGALSMKNFGYGLWGQILGGLIGVIGINLPGLILVLFIVPFWDDLKKISRIRHSLSGINAVSVGFIIAAFVLLLIPMGFNWIFLGIMVATFLLLNFTKVSPPVIVLAGILIGYLF
ncbi:putative chromate transport protein [Pedobacter sp. Bi27]|uniref:chromate efflux transporter n=1 Tax=unclassified Pedobacter TaxID=2628915 RepID=UPI001DD7779E|nr:MULTISPECIES: chromate efflux transporter [unclassified Pedobacter]CAH0147601.1 putative chromate transport protein [Pedobacter sp. Bi36]CAH0203504.1 putative chromate transport protein [Pedobacter sp. Bi126]CAH0261904.1 putative chromate transport protein [Pedobacter sp. Bi27]